MKIIPKTPEQIQLMRQAGTIWRETIEVLKKHIQEGTTLLSLDAIAEETIRSKNAIPAFKDFEGFPNTLCTMLNSEVVHGIPDNRTLKNGDLLTIDGGCIYKGWYSDAAFSIIVGGDEMNPARARFSKTVYQALQQGCQMARTGNTLGDIGWAIEKHITENGYTLCKEYTGHGIGMSMHEEPYVYNYGNRHEGMKLRTGMTLCIEPIVTMGKPKVKILSDGWTVATHDGKDACQWEHCGVVTPDGFDIFV